MAILPYVLKFAPDAVRQELEESGLVQETKTLGEDVRSLLTCEGISHVTVAQLDDELEDDLGGYESDNYMDRDAARSAVFSFYSSFNSRLLHHWMDDQRHFMAHSQRTAGELQNVAQVEDRVPVKKPSETRQQLKDQVVEDQLLFETPEVKFAWTLEAVVRLWRATEKKPPTEPRSCCRDVP